MHAYLELSTHKWKFTIYQFLEPQEYPAISSDLNLKHCASFPSEEGLA